MKLKIIKIPGRCPDVWNRQVVFFANLSALFFGNEKETEVLRQEVGQIESYGGRLVPILNLLFHGPNNLLLLETRPDRDLMEYFQKMLGLKLPEIKIMKYPDYLNLLKRKPGQLQKKPGIIKELRQHPSEYIDGYVTDLGLMQLAKLTGKKILGSRKGSHDGNNKFLLYQYLKKKGLPVFDTCIAAKAADISRCRKKLIAQGYQNAVIKSQIGASGIGMKKIDLYPKSKKAVPIAGYLFYEGPCLVQGWLDDAVDGVEFIGAPSVQMFLQDRNLSLYDITEQILSKDSVHEGNIAPPPYLFKAKKVKAELLRQAEVAARWLHLQGYRGAASVDLQVVKRYGKYQVRLCEINARVTGATYPAVMARYFMPYGSWLMRNIRFPVPVKSRVILKILQKEGLLYKLHRQKGILPVNFNPDKKGMVIKGQFLFLARRLPEVHALLNRLRAVKSFKGIYDRD